ncbi:TIGR03086 family metal-binding protein [Actinoplanes sp. DH11]|uniref:TIGR03086 family metal-binding protein n=1 Tax=Actinoplanes sp. DH11 TaxID=2857011 RepID=UPI001E5C0BC9|nr:TIGR03086 family metal-binding protein [Actinoplanes sp. DH11]
MSTEISELIDAEAPAATGLVRGVRDDQLDAPTPCTDYRVRDLLNHLLQVTGNFADLAARKEVDWSPGPDRLRGDWRAAFGADLRALSAAWGDPAVLEGVSPGMGLPQRTVGLMLVTDLLVHGWDLSVATGQGFDVPPAVLAAGREFLDEMGDMGRKMGAFGPEVAAPAGAGAFARLLARTGRDPGWKP